MRIGSLGYNYTHDADFIMERPNGTGCYLLLLIKSPAVFEINGEKTTVRKNSCVIFSPETPYRYYPEGDSYTDDWVYFNLDEQARRRIEELGIPFDEIMFLGRMEELSGLIHIMACEHYSTDPNHEEIESHYAEIFLLKLSSLVKFSSIDRSQSLADKNYWFTHLRNKMYTLPEETITNVDSLAKQMGMSRSGFQHLYKRIFGVSIMQDITAARMNYAKQLLSATNLSIKAVAEKCGYASEYSFMRRFREQTGKTPTEYRSSV